MKFSAICVVLTVGLVSQLSYGDIVSYTLGGSVVAEVANVTSLTDTMSADVDSSTLLLGGTGGTENSNTTSSLNYNWDGMTLAGTGFIDTEKTIPAKPGGLHQGESTLTFNFTIDETSAYFLTGNFGYVRLTAEGEADTVSWQLTGPSYTASGTANAVSDATVHEQLFSASDTIAAGSYSLVLIADFHETVNNPESRQAGWEITSFTVPAISSVPEPSSFVILSGLSIMALRRRR